MRILGDILSVPILEASEDGRLVGKNLHHPQMRHSAKDLPHHDGQFLPQASQSRSNYVFRQSTTTHKVQTFPTRNFPLTVDKVVKSTGKLR